MSNIVTQLIFSPYCCTGVAYLSLPRTLPLAPNRDKTHYKHLCEYNQPSRSTSGRGTRKSLHDTFIVLGKKENHWYQHTCATKQTISTEMVWFLAQLGGFSSLQHKYIISSTVVCIPKLREVLVTLLLIYLLLPLLLL